MNWFKEAQFDDIPIVEISEIDGSYHAIVNGDSSKIKNYITPLNNDSWMITIDGTTPIQQFRSFMECYNTFIEIVKKELHEQGFADVTRRRKHELV